MRRIICYKEYMYIHQLPSWPHFSWDTEVINKILIDLRYNQGCLIGNMQSIGFSFREAAVLKTLTQDVVKSSEIEGEILEPSLVRSSVARHLGMEIAALDVADKNIDGVVEMVLDATQNYDLVVSKERLFRWHDSLFPMGRSGFSKIRVGLWRSGPVEVVSGQAGKETVHFEGPSAAIVDHEMEVFLNWINEESSLDLVLKAALAHLWFVTIHPFEDGNGRVGRAIADLILARSEKSSQRFYSLSAQIQADRKGYYAILEKTQKGDLDVTLWLTWFLHCVEKAIQGAMSTFEKKIFKESYWKTLVKIPLNERQKKVVNLLLEDFKGKLTTSKWAKINKCSQDTAYRDILDLIQKGIMLKNSDGGRSTSYSLNIQKL